MCQFNRRKINFQFSLLIQIPEERGLLFTIFGLFFGFEAPGLQNGYPITIKLNFKLIQFSEDPLGQGQ